MRDVDCLSMMPAAEYIYARALFTISPRLRRLIDSKTPLLGCGSAPCRKGFRTPRRRIVTASFS